MIEHRQSCRNFASCCLQAAKEARIRLLTGIKRHVHAKRAEGLLSPEGLLRLDEACDHALDNADK